MTATRENIDAALLGKQVTRATSSLTRFAVAFADGSALVLDAVSVGGGPAVNAELAQAADLEFESDAVCKVDWNWIYASSIEQAKLSGDSLRLQLSAAGPLTISVQVWQGKPFLAFQPYRQAK